MCKTSAPRPAMVRPEEVLMRSIVLFAFVASLVGACSGSSGGGGDDDDGPLMPKVIAGGGVANPGIAGTLYVHVVEVDTATPIANASVIVGSTTVMTDAQGLATLTNVTGPQT